MRSFPLLDFQTVMLLTFLGLAISLLLYIAFGWSAAPEDAKGAEEEKETYPGGIETRNKPIPPILIFVYVAFVLWAATYVMVIGLKGGPF